MKGKEKKLCLKALVGFKPRPTKKEEIYHRFSFVRAMMTMMIMTMTMMITAVMMMMRNSEDGDDNNEFMSFFNRYNV